MDMDTVRSLFETNTFGTIAMAQAVLPQMRERRSGVIVNVTSSAIYRPLPLIGAYRAAKAAVNVITESLAAEIGQFGLRAPRPARVLRRNPLSRIRPHRPARFR